MKKKSRLDTVQRVLLTIYFWVLIVGFSYLIFILLTDLKLPCVYYTTLGIECPGCGTTRMFLSLAKLRIADAFNYNPVNFVTLFLGNIYALFAFIGKPKIFRSFNFSMIMLGVYVTFLLIVWIVRLFT